jgi:hypothetical protein
MSVRALTAFENVPTAPQRRVQHALGLAQKLATREKELAEARLQLKEAREALGRLQQKSGDLERLLDNAAQPGRWVAVVVNVWGPQSATKRVVGGTATDMWSSWCARRIRSSIGCERDVRLCSCKVSRIFDRF